MPKITLNKKYQKNLMISIIVLLIAFFSGFFEDYIGFHNNQDNRIESLYKNTDKAEIEDKLSGFSLDKIKELKNTDLFVGNKDYLNNIVQKIDLAKNKIYLETYILTEKRIQKALKKAYDRGLQVKIILEKNVYKAPNLNNKVFYNLKDYGIDITWAKNNYALTHAKFFVIDDSAIISTGNISYSSFTKNRDFFIETSDENIVKILERIFENDFEGINKAPYKHEIALSPVYSRIKLEELINNAKENINIYAQNFSDEKIIKLLVNKANSGIKINIIGPSLSQMENNLEAYNALKNAGINIVEKTSPYIHAKALVIDSKFLLIGSINYSDYSIDKNREVSLVIKNSEIIKKFNKIFEEDLK
ncbi:MAG: phosphatidylserine/phosphatidylglycerophosphate/cardiolipin synthase family protein [Candidatus Gracilibacteria bacterium]|nr:phosphatidylserine/phosphatidylglycerophosphate/cardiolipin synthase family protein [Candidatus Gracilibacteria bacterium]